MSIKHKGKRILTALAAACMMFGSVSTQKVAASPAEESVKAPSEAAENSGQSQAAETYLGGASLTMLAPQTDGQNMSFLLQTNHGEVIVIDGGLDQDADHLAQTIQTMGGRVSAWLITHPHSDHVGALTNLLNRNPIPVQIDNIYCSFLTREQYEKGDHMGRMSDYDSLMAALSKIPAERLHMSLTRGQKIVVDNAEITVMNDPFYTDYNTFNNSSIAYRIDINGKRLMFLGDMGWEPGTRLIRMWDYKELKSDVVQMAHHGQDGAEENLYQVLHPEICFWPTPGWLWDNMKDGIADAGSYKTMKTRAWMERMGVARNYVAKDGDLVLR
ncbi:MAG: MBL fold metallo-hydrolase [Clostridium sp.]|nr:MBL fold metallo-hydrolase [Clostridium sp.]